MVKRIENMKNIKITYTIDDDVDDDGELDTLRRGKLIFFSLRHVNRVEDYQR